MDERFFQCFRGFSPQSDGFLRVEDFKFNLLNLPLYLFNTLF